MALLQVDNLKTYFKSRRGDVHAVDGISFSVDRGKTLGTFAKNQLGIDELQNLMAGGKELQSLSEELGGTI